MSKKNEIYLEIFSVEEEGTCLAPIETLVALFAIKYCEAKINIKLVVGESSSRDIPCFKVDISWTEYAVLRHGEIPFLADSCQFPNAIVNEDTVVAGLCAILRVIVKEAMTENEEHRCLLGFKDSCLLAPSETSVWTKFCEVDLVEGLKEWKKDKNGERSKDMPISWARFEAHMSEPVRLHNVYKYTMSKKSGMKGGDKGLIPEHLYAEGSSVTLADVIIFLCFHIFMNEVSDEWVRELLPLSTKWYDRMMENDRISRCIDCIVLEKVKMRVEFSSRVLPHVEKQSLYKSDPKRYKPRNRIYTRQEEVESSLRLVDQMTINAELDVKPFAAEINVDWNKIPYEGTPEGGALPATRLKRKYQQLENLCRPVLSLARKNQVIVDFCSGSGHLGILVACLLPECTVVLLENKEESLSRSKIRVKKIGLANVMFFQCNLNYFKAEFDIGMSLHACGVATDLVMQHCIRRRAVFVCCPCCYGSVQDSSRVAHPRSQVFQKAIAKRDYFVLRHAADQTHDEKNAKTTQGNGCMAIVDTDRKLHAQQFGYTVHLAKLVPETCTPKNHLLVGIPKCDVVR